MVATAASEAHAADALGALRLAAAVKRLPGRGPGVTGVTGVTGPAGGMAVRKVVERPALSRRERLERTLELARSTARATVLSEGLGGDDDAAGPAERGGATGAGDEHGRSAHPGARQVRSEPDAGRRADAGTIVSSRAEVRVQTMTQTERREKTENENDDETVIRRWYCNTAALTPALDDPRGLRHRRHLRLRSPSPVW